MMSEPVPDNAASTLDDKAHQEFMMMYRECATSIRYAKSKQWHTLSGALLFFVMLGSIGEQLDKADLLHRICVGLSVLVTVCSIYCLVIYQEWQNNERRKLIFISQHLSADLRKIRAINSSGEAKFHRYTLLAFMLMALIIANLLLVMALERFSY